MRPDELPKQPDKLNQPHWLLKAIITAFCLPLFLALILIWITGESQKSPNHGESTPFEESKPTNGSSYDTVTYPLVYPSDQVDRLIDESSQAIERLDGMREESHQARDELFEALGDMLEESKRFEDLEGNEPRSNYRRFLRHFNGLGGFGEMGDSLIESLLGKEVEWALRVREIITEDNSAFVLLGPTRPVCDSCEEDIFDQVFLHSCTSADFLTKIKEEDYIFVEGELALLPVENSENWTMRERMHIHWESIKYRRSNDRSNETGKP